MPKATNPLTDKQLKAAPVLDIAKMPVARKDGVQTWLDKNIEQN